jgi:hypothetical protein
MNNALKGALLSGLVYPGIGHMVLKQYKRGVVLMVAVSVALLVIIIKAVQQAFLVLEKIEAQGGMIDLRSISKAATQASTIPDSLMVNLLLLILICCWVIGIVDAYRIGRKKDTADRLPEQV